MTLHPTLLGAHLPIQGIEALQSPHYSQGPVVVEQVERAKGNVERPLELEPTQSAKLDAQQRLEAESSARQPQFVPLA
eukprot:CAMPEP_0205852956 /NCGR_PEP_ID=MMETSP1083-20121108/1289_1 /ASSEMBLY_ACC=CAM_ASM_000430 /TAXON_ID=97485 /ORGANISM="Prymnesium parvum, Strain Texoma1" /LENGTH=77 /DNA_ID=CAMNT_0053214181 /DNA_START=311 /DNA_END=545 /DNA_ORIENTATION=+